MSFGSAVPCMLGLCFHRLLRCATSGVSLALCTAQWPWCLTCIQLALADMMSQSVVSITLYALLIVCVAAAAAAVGQLHLALLQMKSPR